MSPTNMLGIQKVISFFKNAGRIDAYLRALRQHTDQIVTKPQTVCLYCFHHQVFRLNFGKHTTLVLYLINGFFPYDSQTGIVTVFSDSILKDLYEC